MMPTFADDENFDNVTIFPFQQQPLHGMGWILVFLPKEWDAGRTNETRDCWCKSVLSNHWVNWSFNQVFFVTDVRTLEAVPKVPDDAMAWKHFPHYWPFVKGSACDRWIPPYKGSVMRSFNTLRPRQNGRHFPDDIFKCIFLNENVWISIKISLNFVPKDPINNISALVQIMAWRRPGDKPLSEPMMVQWPQWVNDLFYVCLNKLLNKFRVAPIWHALTLMWHPCNILECFPVDVIFYWVKTLWVYLPENIITYPLDDFDNCFCFWALFSHAIVCIISRTETFLCKKEWSC